MSESCVPVAVHSQMKEAHTFCGTIYFRLQDSPFLDRTFTFDVANYNRGGMISIKDDNGTVILEIEDDIVDENISDYNFDTDSFSNFSPAQREIIRLLLMSAADGIRMHYIKGMDRTKKRDLRNLTLQQIKHTICPAHHLTSTAPNLRNGFGAFLS